MRKRSPDKVPAAAFPTNVSVPMVDLQYHSSYGLRPSSILQMSQFQQTAANEGSIGSSTLDFLSLCGNSLSHRPEPIATREHLESLGYWSAQLKFVESDLGYSPWMASSHSHAEISQQHASSLNKQLQEACLEQKALKVPSEDDEDENGDQLHDRDTSENLEGKVNDNKRITLRSKHSATEQRRRSKINDRFQMLRQLVPNHDQKRDKASFLLEVIEYIKFLQEKVRKYEATEHARQQERVKNISLDVKQGSTVDIACVDSLIAYGKEHFPVVSTVPSDEKHATDESDLMRPQFITVTIPSELDVLATELLSSKGHVSMHLDRSVQALQWANITKPIPSFASKAYIHHTVSCPALKIHGVEKTIPPIIKSKDSSCVVKGAGLPHFHGSIPLPNQIMNMPDEQWQLEHNIRKHASGQHNIKSSQSHEELQTPNPNRVPDLLISGTNFSEQVLNADTTGASYEKVASTSRQLLNAAVTCTSCETNKDFKVESQENGKIEGSGMEPLTIHGGVINISSTYSQGLLDKLAWALQTTGLDLSQASISIQIDLGRQGEGMAATTSKVVSIHSQVSQQSQGSETKAGELDRPSKKPRIDVGG